MAQRTFKWVLEVEVSEDWVADGFDITEENVQDIANALNPYAIEGEYRVRILQAPAPELVRQAQGY